MGLVFLNFKIKLSLKGVCYSNLCAGVIKAFNCQNFHSLASFHVPNLVHYMMSIM